MSNGFSTESAQSLKGFQTKHNSLNLLRLFFAGLVLFQHSFDLGGYIGGPGLLGNKLSGWAVIGFFCISGYLIAASRENSRFDSFLVKRIARLFPAYVVCALMVVFFFAAVAHCIVTGSLDGFLSTPPTPLDYLVQNLNFALSVNQYNIGTALSNAPYPYAWNGSLWTLQIELLSYLMIGVLFCFVHKKRFIWVLSSFLLLCIAQFNLDFISHYTASGLVQNILWLCPFFFGGSLTYYLLKKVPLNWHIALFAFVVTVAVLVFTPIRGWFGTGLLSPLITYIILWFASTFPMGRLGGFTLRHDISYGVYIYAFPVQQLLALIIKTCGFDVPVLGFIFLSIVFCLPFAIASWLFVEKPIMTFVKRSLKKT